MRLPTGSSLLGNISRCCTALLCGISLAQAASQTNFLKLTRAEYEDRVQAIWTAQIVGVQLGLPFEHKVASTEWVDQYPKRYTAAMVDDDWYYEMCAVRAFEKYGVGMTAEQLGRQWLENSCGSWGSSEQARLLLASGTNAPDTGHPRNNRFWFAIGSQFSSEVYGAIAPGMPNLAAENARRFGQVNGYGEAVDGAMFISGMVSLGFVERDTKTIVRKAAQLIAPASPYRKCLDLIITMADAGKGPQEIADAVEERWHIEYPATINAVPNGGLVAVGLWFGEGDFLKTVNIIFRVADFTDTDCNAANAGAVLAAMHGMKALPAHLVEALHDRILGAKLGTVKLTPPVDESISALARRTAAIGERLLVANGAKLEGDSINIPAQAPITQPTDLFPLSNLTQFWNADWKLERAGIGGAGRGIGNARGLTHLEGDVLATWPRDPVRGVVLRRNLTVGTNAFLTFQAGADATRAWELMVYAGNELKLTKVVAGGTDRKGPRTWEDFRIDLSNFAGKQTQLRLYQRTLLADQIPGNAYWKNVQVTGDKTSP